MYVHRIRSGTKGQFLKVLLRESFRVGAKVKQRTLANLTSWDTADIMALEKALAVRRVFPPDERCIAAAEAQVYSLIAARKFPSKPGASFQILASLRRPHGTNPITGQPPILGTRNREALRA